MKRLNFHLTLLPLLLTAAFVLWMGGCSKSPQTEDNMPVSTNIHTVDRTEGRCGTTTCDLWAGQTIDVGSVTIENDGSNLYVTYKLDYPGACFGILHMWAGNDLTNLPTNPQGIPVPGQFKNADGGAEFDASGLTEYTFTIPFSELNLVDLSNPCNAQIYVVTHAEVDMNCDGNASDESAFGCNIPGSGPRWWFYGTYIIKCNCGTPEPPFCQTAFAKGGWVWTTDKKANPENLPSLNLMKNRWGWAINLTAPGTTSYNIWAGAGLNDTKKGKKVGTLTIDWDGTNAAVTYTMFEGYCMEEAHLYGNDPRPTTTAPGQYGYLQDFDPNASTHTFNIPLVDSNGTDGVWLIAHAVVCNGCGE